MAAFIRRHSGIRFRRQPLKYFLYVVYASIVVILFSCTHGGYGSGYSGYGTSSARSGYSSYGAHK